MLVVWLKGQPFLFHLPKICLKFVRNFIFSFWKKKKITHRLVPNFCMSQIHSHPIFIIFNSKLFKNQFRFQSVKFLFLILFITWYSNKRVILCLIDWMKALLSQFHSISFNLFFFFFFFFDFKRKFTGKLKSWHKKYGN